MGAITKDKPINHINPAFQANKQSESIKIITGINASKNINLISDKIISQFNNFVSF